jgi:hypothetical protein
MGCQQLVHDPAFPGLLLQEVLQNVEAVLPRPDPASQIRAVRSVLLDARYLPSGLQATP